MTNTLCYCKKLELSNLCSLHIHPITTEVSESTLIVEEEKALEYNGLVQTTKPELLRIVKSNNHSYLVVGGNFDNSSPGGKHHLSHKTQSNGQLYRILIWYLAGVYSNPRRTSPRLLETNGTMTGLCLTTDRTIMVSTESGQIQIWKSDTTAEDGNEKEDS